MKITKIVLTGGPCAGKTTGINTVKKHFEDLGMVVYIIPEQASLFINVGLNPVNLDKDQYYNFQKNSF